MDLSMDPLTKFKAGTVHTIHHLMLDQILETIIGTQARTTRTDRQGQQWKQRVPTE